MANLRLYQELKFRKIDCFKYINLILFRNIFAYIDLSPKPKVFYFVIYKNKEHHELSQKNGQFTMNKIILFLTTLITFISFNYLLNASDFELSDNKIKTINGIINDYNDKDITQKTTQNLIFEKINKLFPINDNDKDEIKQITKFEILKLATKLTTEKYHKNLNTLKLRYSQIAKEKYKTPQINSQITIEFKYRNKTYKITGTYFGYNGRANGIKVGKRVIPIYDISPKYSYMFDKKICIQKQNILINNKIKKYLKKKQEYLEKQNSIAMQQLEKNNLDAGYIFFNKTWKTPETVTLTLLQKRMSEQNELEDGPKTTNKPKPIYDKKSIDKKLSLDKNNPINKTQSSHQNRELTKDKRNNKQENKKVEDEMFQHIQETLNPTFLYTFILLVSICSILSFVCFILALISLFKNGKTGLGIACVILTFISGLGQIILFFYCWTKSSKFNIRKLMKIWTLSVIINIILIIYLFWKLYSMMLTLLSNQ